MPRLRCLPGGLIKLTRFEQISAGIEIVRGNIETACARAGRPTSDVRLIAVSKKMPAADIAAAGAAGQIDFGENYAQELAAKASSPELAAFAPRWHFLGGLQSRKVREILPFVTSIHSVDRDSVIDELEKRAVESRPIDVYLEVNVGDESQKSGAAPGDAGRLCRRLLAIPGIRLQGLMCIPPVMDNPEDSRPYFAALRMLRDRLRAEISPPDGLLSGLSMGMTADYAVAIAEGATVVRVGTAIFGARQ